MALGTCPEAYGPIMFTPEWYAQLKNQTRWAPESWPVITAENNLYLVVGEYYREQTFGPFWPSSFQKPLINGDKELVGFASLLQHYVDNDGPEKYKEALGPC